MTTIRMYLRRSKNDEGKQQFSVDVQRDGCRQFIERNFELPDVAVVEYLDDGKAGDDFHSRLGMRRLLEEAETGDIIVCRDQSRLGRDAIEVTLAIRDLVRDRGCRLYYYITGQEVLFANAIDQATTFIQGTGHQMELEAIRSRTREALRSRVREGRIAGGRCYGYELVRKSDGTGRGYTIAVVDGAQAEIVRRIFSEYLEGYGLKHIAKALNREGVPSPTVGRKGSGSWMPSGIRAMLHNPRYRGVYIHGRIKKVRRGGRTVRVKADPSEVITVDVPEWRIVDNDIWFAVQDKFAARRRNGAAKKRSGRPAAKYPLAGIAKCGVCGGSIGCSYAKRRGERVKSYSCRWHHQRGSSACPVTVQQPMDEVEAALIDYLQHNILTEDVMQSVMANVRREIEAQMPGADDDSDTLEAELKSVRAEQRRLAKAVALADDIPELVTELQQRSARIRYLETKLDAARRTPEMVAALVDELEKTTRNKLGDLHSALAHRADLRQVFLSLFPEGLTFHPEWGRGANGRRRRIWRIAGSARMPTGPLCNTTRSAADEQKSEPGGAVISGTSESGPLCVATPTGHDSSWT